MAVKSKKTKKAVNQARGKRYTADEIREILSFAAQVDAEKGRGGITAAGQKYGVTPLTISAWRRKAGEITPRAGRTPADIGEALKRMTVLAEEIAALREQLDAKELEYKQLRAKI